MKTKRDLVGFQRRLFERLEAAATRRVEPAQLALDSGGEHWLVELADARELIPVPPLTEIPGTKTWFRGVAGIRGELLAVIDFAAFRDRGTTALSHDSRILIPHVRFGVNAALLFAGSLGLKDTRAFERADGESTWRDAAGGRWSDVRLSELLAAPRFLDIAA